MHSLGHACAQPPSSALYNLATISLLQGLFKLAARTYNARRSLSSLDVASIGASDEAALADLLAGETDVVAGLTTNSSSGTLAASANGNLTATAGKRSSAGEASSGGGSAKVAKGKAAGASRRNRRPTVREEIDAW